MNKQFLKMDEGNNDWDWSTDDYIMSDDNEMQNTGTFDEKKVSQTVQQNEEGTPIHELLSTEIEDFYKGFDQIVLNNDIGTLETKQLATNYCLPYNDARFLKFDEKLQRDRCLAFIIVSAFKEGEKVGPLKTGMPEGTGFRIPIVSMDNLIESDDIKTTRGKSLDGSYDIGSLLIVAEKPIEECVGMPLANK